MRLTKFDSLLWFESLISAYKNCINRTDRAIILTELSMLTAVNLPLAFFMMQLDQVRRMTSAGLQSTLPPFPTKPCSSSTLTEPRRSFPFRWDSCSCPALRRPLLGRGGPCWPGTNATGSVPLAARPRGWKMGGTRDSALKRIARVIKVSGRKFWEISGSLLMFHFGCRT